MSAPKERGGAGAKAGRKRAETPPAALGGESLRYRGDLPHVLTNVGNEPGQAALMTCRHEIATACAPQRARFAN